MCGARKKERKKEGIDDSERVREREGRMLWTTK